LPPLLLGASGHVAWLDLPRATLLGISETPVFTTKSLKLGPMDSLLLYTDGVNEAMNPDKQLFGEDRLFALAAPQTGSGPKELVESLLAAVHRFAEGEEQSDDITVLALRYRGKRGTDGVRSSQPRMNTDEH
jgi:phosphoserine phosphatase RsbU/P